MSSGPSSSRARGKFGGDVILYRPTGLDELGLIYDLGMRAFPPRLPEQPIFYPVTTLAYATAIAHDWNVKGRNAAGYVTRFALEAAYAATFERHIVGGREHEELWVPAEQLGRFNDHIVGTIELVAAFYGNNYAGVVPSGFMLKGRSASEQFLLLASLFDDFPMDFHFELRTNHRAVWLNYPFWAQSKVDVAVLPPTKQEATLRAIREDWPNDVPALPLFDQV